jgi:hypothetical protein
MPSKPPKSRLGTSPEEELRFVRSLGKSDTTKRRSDSAQTKTEKRKVRGQVEDFIESGRVRSYPEIEADLKEEAALTYGGAEPLSVLTALVESAIHKGTRPPVLLATTIAGMLLRSYDERFGCDVERLPAAALTTARVLAHVVALPARLEPRVAVAIARRAVQVLLNRGSLPPPAPSGPEPDESPPPDGPEPERESEEPDEDLCVECGASYPRGASHRCASENEPSATAEAAPEAVVSHIEPSATPEPAADAAVSHSEAAALAPFEQAPPDPKLPAVGAPPEPAKEPAPPRHEHVPRKVIGYARTRVDHKFFFEEGIGKDGHFEVLAAGAVVEVLEPNERDRADQDYQKRRDANEKRAPRQLVVVRWWGGVSLLWGADVERASEQAYKDYTAEAARHEAARQDQDGDRSAGRPQGAPGP